MTIDPAHSTRTSPKRHYDVVVVGGGAAGLSGAKILARSRRSVLVVDAGEPRNAPAAGVHNYLYAEGIAPRRLREVGRAEARDYGVDVVEGAATSVSVVPAPSRGSARFRLELTTTGGRVASVSARRLLLATGVVDGLPAVPGLAQRWGRDVLHCPFCHGWEIRDQAIGVLGTSTMGPVQVQLFRRLSEDVVYFQHTAPDPSAEQREQMTAVGVALVTGEVAAVESVNDRLTSVRMTDGRVIGRQAVVVATTLRAREDLLGDLGLAVSKQTMGGAIGTYLETGPSGATAVPGVWAAGNVSAPMVQVIDSAAAGAGAGASIHMDLLDEDVEVAVAAHQAQQTVGTVR